MQHVAEVRWNNKFPGCRSRHRTLTQNPDLAKFNFDARKSRPTALGYFIVGIEVSLPHSGRFALFLTQMCRITIGYTHCRLLDSDRQFLLAKQFCAFNISKIGQYIYKQQNNLNNDRYLFQI